MKDSKIQPLSNRVVIKPESAEIKTSSGIFIPSTVKSEKSDQGVVIAVGPGKLQDNGKLVPMTLSVGQRVIYPKWQDEIEAFGEKYIIVSEDSVMAIISE